MRFFRRLHRTLFRRRYEADLAAEMQTHVELETERRIALGENPTTARRRAAATFGSIDARTEEVRERRLAATLEDTVRQLRYAARGLRKSPIFTLVAVGTIAVAIGSGTAVFSLLHAILLRSLPVPAPEQLRIVHWAGSDVHMRSLNDFYNRVVGNVSENESVNHPTFTALRDGAADLADVLGYVPLLEVTALSNQQAFAATGLMVSDNFFSTLGVTAELGRTFQPGDEAAGVPLAVISHRLWQSHFGGDPTVLGRTLRMHGVLHEIVGVLPAGFAGIRPGQATDLYVPLTANSPFLYVGLGDDWHWFIRLLARVHPGVTDAALAGQLGGIFADHARDSMTDPHLVLRDGSGGLNFDRDTYRAPLQLMLLVTGLVLLVACANLAGLSLARGAARQHELAVRQALGAGRRRLIRQAFIESAELATLGGAGGLLLALWLQHGLSILLAGHADGLAYTLSLDGQVLAFALLAAAATAFLAGLLPAWRAGGIDPLQGLRSRGAVGAPSLRWGRVLVVAQICLSLIVLAGAGLTVRSLQKLRDIDPGFTTDGLTVLHLSPASAGYADASRIGFYHRAQAALAALPGVESVGLLQFRPLTGERSIGGVDFTSLPPAEPGHERYTYRQMVSPGTLATLGIPLVAGRAIEPSDGADAPKVVVVNEAFVRHNLPPGTDPLGHTFPMWGAVWRIVGVAADAVFTDVKEAPPPTSYFPVDQRFYDRYAATSVASANLVLRSSLDPAALTRAARQALREVDASVPVTHPAPLSALLNQNLGRERMIASLGTLLAGLALFLCAIGLYGLIAYDVTRRQGELAVRMAIGARRDQIARPILRDTLTLALIGIGLGLPGLWASTRLLQSQLHGVKAHDPATLLAAVALLLLLAALAAIIPAWRATRIDPLVALRGE